MKERVKYGRTTPFPSKTNRLAEREEQMRTMLSGAGNNSKGAFGEQLNLMLSKRLRAATTLLPKSKQYIYGFLFGRQLEFCFLSPLHKDFPAY